MKEEDSITIEFFIFASDHIVLAGIYKLLLLPPNSYSLCLRQALLSASHHSHLHARVTYSFFPEISKQ